MANARHSEGWVYFIGTKPGSPVKIGHTVWPEKRLTNIQHGSPVRLEILAAALTPCAGIIEGLLHDRFASSRLNGEWFTWTRRVGGMVRGVQRRDAHTLGLLRCSGHTLVSGRYYHPDE